MKIGNGRIFSAGFTNNDTCSDEVKDRILLSVSYVLFLGKRGVKYQGHISSSRFECTRKRNPQFISLARGQIAGESQWVKEIERKRKEQRFLFKAEKRSKVKDRNLLQRSAVSDPPAIPGAAWLPLPRRKLEEEEEEKQKLIE